MNEHAATQTLPADPERLAALCALWQANESDIWITLQGGSMTPTFLPGSRLQIHCCRREIAVNDIAVFRDGARLVAHRVQKIIEISGKERQFLCLGDGNVFMDMPVPESSLLGRVIAAAPSPLWRRIVFLFLHPRRHSRYFLRRLRPAAPLSP